MLLSLGMNNGVRQNFTSAFNGIKYELRQCSQRGGGGSVVVVVAHEERRTGNEREKRMPRYCYPPYKLVHSIIGANSRARVGHTSQCTLLSLSLSLSSPSECRSESLLKKLHLERS